MKSNLSTISAFAGVLALILAVGCRVDGTDTKMQWAPDMADSAANKAQRSYLDPPEGSLSMSVPLYQGTVEDFEKNVVMPADVANDPAQGQKLYETFCSVCHGVDAKGGHINPAIQPPDLTHPSYLARADGFYFYRITFGSAIMPSYGHAISAPERWLIIKHLRTLQKAGK